MSGAEGRTNHARFSTRSQGVDISLCASCLPEGERELCLLDSSKGTSRCCTLQSSGPRCLRQTRCPSRATARSLFIELGPRDRYSVADAARRRCSTSLAEGRPGGCCLEENGFLSPRHMMEHTTPSLCRGTVLVDFEKTIKKK